jgi:hypothetical protein
MMVKRFIAAFSSPVGGGGARNAVEGECPIRSARGDGGGAPPTTLRVVPLPQWGRSEVRA